MTRPIDLKERLQALADDGFIGGAGRFDLTDCLTPEIHKELVAQAYKDAANPRLFPNSKFVKEQAMQDKNKPGYFSNVECFCGCETLLPQHLVDRGHKYLYNHKPKDLRQKQQIKTVRKDRLNGPMYTGKTNGATSLSEAAIAMFYEAQLKITNAQLDELQVQQDAMDVRRDQLWIMRRNAEGVLRIIKQKTLVETVVS